MSGAMREKDAADFDLERFTEMFDRAMTSSDPRVKNALRQLMMMVILTDEGDHEAGQRVSHGPLRRMQGELRDCFRWIQRLEQEVEKLKQANIYNESNRQVSPLGGYRTQDNTGQAIPGALSSTEYWNQVVAQKIPEYVFQDLSIKVNGGLLPKEQK